jgi:alpha-glucosidase
VVSSDWWRDATIYQVYVRSFADSDGDGVGDLDGIRERLGYLELLGVDALSLTPFFRSPMADGGYDVADPRDVDALFGGLTAFDRLVAEAHRTGIKVTIDLVPNHTSDQHVWFAEAVADPYGPARDRYIFRPGRGDGPPNNWISIAGGSAWTRLPDGQWYLHLFDTQQPDLNWEHPEVRADFERTLRFWLDRGVDGFRIDGAHGMAKPAGLPDMDPRAGDGIGQHDLYDPRFDDEGVHDIHRLIRRVLGEYPGTMAVGEIWVTDSERLALYLRPDELHLGFNFRLMLAGYDAVELRTAIDASLDVAAMAGVQPTWTLSNHDVVREATRYGDGALGTQRARAMALVELGLPGVVYLYNGAELGLPNVQVPEWAIQDQRYFRSGGQIPGRDGCRVPLPWEGAEPPFGFSPGATTWLPMPPEWAKLTVEHQLEDADSTLSLYRHAIELRKTHPSFAGSELEWYGAPAGCFAYRRKGGGLICVLNASEVPVPLPAGEILLASGPLNDRHLPPNTAAWLAQQV